MSRDSKHDKDDPRRRRNDGEPSWYDKAVNADYQEEVIPIPEGKAGLIIGKKGWRIKDIKEQTGVKELNIRDDQVHIKGTEEQCSKAKKIIDRILEVLFKSHFFQGNFYTYVPVTDLTTLLTSFFCSCFLLRPYLFPLSLSPSLPSIHYPKFYHGTFYCL